ncbi:hypothetical protein TYRP_021225 [Tyrophagus putrescentiae]|nr:hypothetical protein TYRP_021225 [Tyrophagus putrescentiae]
MIDRGGGGGGGGDFITEIENTYVIGLDDGVRVGRLHHVFPLFMVLHLAVNVVARVRLTTGAIGTGKETAKDETKDEGEDEAMIKRAQFHG